MAGCCCDRTEKTKRQQQLAPMLIVSSKLDGTHYSRTSTVLSFFVLPSQASDVFLSAEIKWHNTTLRLEQSHNPCLYIKYRSEIKACGTFILKETCWRGAPPLTKSLQLSWQRLPSFPAQALENDKSCRPEAEANCLVAAKLWQDATGEFICLKVKRCISTGLVSHVDFLFVTTQRGWNHPVGWMLMHLAE